MEKKTRKTKKVPKPLSDRVLVRRERSEDISKGGIIIPDASKEKPLIGTVVAVGPGRVNSIGDLTPMYVAAGDEIMFGRYAGSEINIGGNDYLLLKQDDIQLTLVEEYVEVEEDGSKNDNVPQ